jgi:hypothetical protein
MYLRPDELFALDVAAQAHGKWISRLSAAIRDGSSEFTPDVVVADNRCDFGRWLYGDFPEVLKGTPEFDEIRHEHAEFHRSAAHVLELAIAGRKDDALRLLAKDGDFMLLSGSLLLKLRGLRR